MTTLRPKVLHFDSLPSTNTEAARQAQEGAAEGVTIVAGEQTAGRGRLERRWISPAGSGLYASVILRPRFSASLWSLIPLMAALAVYDALTESCGLHADIKWPNDIIISGRKLSGILAETVDTPIGRAVILGMGINLTTQSFPEELRDLATSVEEATGNRISVEVLLESLLTALSDRYHQLEDDSGRAQIVEDWMVHSSYARDKRVCVSNHDEQLIGITRGLEQDGALRIETSTGEIRIVRAGDVTGVRSEGN